MSFYTVFDSETVVTTTTTANLMAPTDPVLIASSALKRKAQSTVGQILTLQQVTTVTSASTGTVIASAVTNVLTPSLNLSYQLADPAQKGQTCFLYLSSTTSTAVTITPISATISGSESTSGQAAAIVFKSAPASIELTAFSTALWLVTARSGSIVCT